MSYNFVADCFDTKNFVAVADFLAAKCDFTAKAAVLRFEPFLWGLGQRTMFILGSKSTSYNISVN